MKRSLRVRVMKSIVTPKLSTFGKTRPWTLAPLARMQRVLSQAIRRCFDMHLRLMHATGVTDEALRQAAQWEPIKATVMRQTMTWLGHVARMPIERRPKQFMFGWWQDHVRKAHPIRTQAQWMETVVTHAGVTLTDWFRLAQDKAAWRTAVHRAFPVHKVDKELEARVNEWTITREPPPMQEPSQASRGSRE